MSKTNNAPKIEIKPHPEDVIDVAPEIISLMKARLKSKPADPEPIILGYPKENHEARFFILMNLPERKLNPEVILIRPKKPSSKSIQELLLEQFNDLPKIDD